MNTIILLIMIDLLTWSCYEHKTICRTSLHTHDSAIAVEVVITLTLLFVVAVCRVHTILAVLRTGCLCKKQKDEFNEHTKILTQEWIIIKQL